MKNTSYELWTILVFCLITGCIVLSGLTLAHAAEKAGVKIMSKELVGEFLADGSGISLYVFSKDEKNTSNCLEGCAINWPPFHIAPHAAAPGLDPNNLGTITRNDGRQQTTYKGMPLYYFKNDKYPGDTFGQGLGEVWFLIAP